MSYENVAKILFDRMCPDRSGSTVKRSVMTRNVSAEIFTRMILSGFMTKSGAGTADCGANAEGGHGFQPGNTCAKEDGIAEDATGEKQPVKEQVAATPESTQDAKPEQSDNSVETLPEKPPIAPREIPGSVDSKLRRQWRDTRRQMEDLKAKAQDAVDHGGEPLTDEESKSLHELKLQERAILKNMEEEEHFAFFKTHQAKNIFQANVRYLESLDETWNADEAEYDVHTEAESLLQNAIDNGDHNLTSEADFPETKAEAMQELADILEQHEIDADEFKMISDVFYEANSEDITVRDMADLIGGKLDDLFDADLIAEDIADFEEKKAETFYARKTESGEITGTALSHETIKRQADIIIEREGLGIAVSLDTDRATSAEKLIDRVIYRRQSDDTAKVMAAYDNDRNAVADAIIKASESKLGSLTKPLDDQEKRTLRSMIGDSLDAYNNILLTKLTPEENTAVQDEYIATLKQHLSIGEKLKKASTGVSKDHALPIAKAASNISDEFYVKIENNVEETQEFEAWKSSAYDDFVNEAESNAPSQPDKDIYNGKFGTNDAG